MTTPRRNHLLAEEQGRRQLLSQHPFQHRVILHRSHGEERPAPLLPTVVLRNLQQRIQEAHSPLRIFVGVHVHAQISAALLQNRRFVVASAETSDHLRATDELRQSRLCQQLQLPIRLHIMQKDDCSSDRPGDAFNASSYFSLQKSPLAKISVTAYTTSRLGQNFLASISSNSSMPSL